MDTPRRLARIERDLEWVLGILEPTSPLAGHLDPWGDERPHVYTAREALRRVRERLKNIPSDTSRSP